MRRLVVVPFLLAACLLAAVVRAADTPLPDGLYAEIATPRGTLTAELFFEKAPLTVANFTGLAEGSLGPGDPATGAPRPFFDGLVFHRVVPGFVIQGGDPLGTGEGGPGYDFPDEFAPGLRHDDAGVLSMANSGPDTNGSQWFITLREVNRLNYLHSVFGRVVRGRELLPQIQQGDTMRVKILRMGEKARAFRADAETFARLAAAAPRAQPEPFDDPENLLPTDPPRARAFNAKLANVARFTAARLYVRLYKSFTPSPAQPTAADAARSVADSLRLGKRGVLAVYFAESDEWQLVLGADDARHFNPPGSPQSLDQAVRSFQAEIRAAADTLIETAAKTVAPDKPLTPAQRIKLKTDAMVDALIQRFETVPR